ncbi:MAG TPA: trypsin-like peptidase domain-containing protein [Ignavibacteria bacterium]
MQTRIINISLILFTLFIYNNVTAQDANTIYQKTVSSVGLITDNNVLASGFFVNENTFVTNNHVANDINIRNSLIILENGNRIEVIKLIDKNEEKDLAILRTKKVLNYLKLADLSTIVPGEKVYAIGNPTSENNIYKFAITEGIVNNVTNEIMNFGFRLVSKVILHSAILNKGNSGGPLLNSKGDVIGVNSYHNSGKSQYFAIHESELLTFLKFNNIRFSISKSQQINTPEIKPPENPPKDSIQKKDTIQKKDSTSTKKMITKDDNSAYIIAGVICVVFLMIFLLIITKNSKNRGFNNNFDQTVNWKAVQSQQNQYNNIQTFKTDEQVINNRSESQIVKGRLQYMGKAFFVEEDELTIGRNPGCNIVIRDKYISKVHCSIRANNGEFYLTDLNSKNGTKINGIKKKYCELKNGDVISFGNVQIIFNLIF